MIKLCTKLTNFIKKHYCDLCYVIIYKNINFGLLILITHIFYVVVSEIDLLNFNKILTLILE